MAADEDFWQTNIDINQLRKKHLFGNMSAQTTLHDSMIEKNLPKFYWISISSDDDSLLY